MSYTGGNEGVTGEQRPRLLEQVRARLRVKHYSVRTEQAYVAWIRRFVIANGRRHPREMAQAEVEAFLTGLATEGQVSAGTQNQALAALLFLYREVLEVELPWMEGLVRAKRPRRLPVVLSRDEVARLLAALEGPCWLMGSLLYGSGMRLLECLRLRIKDVDAVRGEITVRDGKGGKDRRVPLPVSLRPDLERQRAHALVQHATDRASGGGRVHLPHALARKYPGADLEPGWQYLFPSARLSTDPRTGRTGRHHVSEEVLQRAVKRARVRAGILKPPPATHCGIRSRRICSKRGTTFARCRNCSGTRTSRRRRSTPMCWGAVRPRSRARWTGCSLPGVEHAGRRVSRRPGRDRAPRPCRRWRRAGRRP